MDQTTPSRPSPLSFETGRQSPFQRQNSSAQTTMRATTPTQSPTKAANLSSLKNGSLSPEKTSPFVRRPSQMSQASDRPSSPFGRRPTSALGLPVSPSKYGKSVSKAMDEEDTTHRIRNHSTSMTPEPSEKDITSSLPQALQSPFDGSISESPATTVLGNTRSHPVATRFTTGSSTPSTNKPPAFAISAQKATPKLSNAVGGYNHVPQPLLRSMRESFEVLDSGNSGAITSASVSQMLEQMGLDSTPAHVKNFFPPNAPSQLNLARYLDMLSGPLADLSHADELTAAFEAFDVDDSGQIDIGELRNALLNTAPEPGETMTRLSERELDSVLGEFAGRRAFGAKGLNVAKSKGDVFRYRDFMASVSGGGGTSDQVEASVGA
nr:myosin regulatory light chain 1 [Quercus suber]